MTHRVVRLKPYEYVHILDNNTCEVTLLEGPCCFTLMDHHINLHETPQPYIVIPPNHYCEVQNPAEVSPDGKTVVYHVGHREIRVSQPPFPLYPGEVVSDVKPMHILTAREAIIVRALEDHTTTTTEGGKNEVETKRTAGEKWLVKGPCVYVPRIDEEVVKKVEPLIVARYEFLKLCATTDFQESDGTLRRMGDVWNMTTQGLFFPGPNVELIAAEKGIILSPTLALHVQAVYSFYDANFGVERCVGDRWLVTHDVIPLFLPNENELPETTVPLTVVGEQQYCVVVNVVRDGVCHHGERELREGFCSFFLQPGEYLEGNEVKNAYIIGAHEALLVEAISHIESAKENLAVSSRWLVYGPCSYIPPLKIRVVERRERKLLTGNGGVYVRNISTGTVKAVYGQAIMLGENEVIWEKPVNPLVYRLLKADQLSVYDANALKLAAEEENSYTSSTVVFFKVPHNALVQLYDSSTNTRRVEAGPTAVFLGPNEEFTPISLSGGKPKTPNCIHSLCLFLGPDFMSDMVEVETLDHARLRLSLTYNWEFDTSDKEEIKKIAFAVSDFIGKTCNTLANRIRVAIAAESFENFHRNSSSLIRQAIFSSQSGVTETRENGLYFPVNGLLITNVDVQSVEPVEPKTFNALKKSVQLAVEIITKSQENDATHQATLLEQEVKGALELQLMNDKVLEEKERVTLLQVTAENATIELGGSSKAQALAESEARLVELQAELDVAPTRCKSLEVVTEAELDILQQRVELEIVHRSAMNQLAVAKAKALADIMAQKTEKIFAALGKATVTAIARAGPELKAKLLQGLGLKGFLVTDGSSPINLLGMANHVVSDTRDAH